MKPIWLSLLLLGCSDVLGIEQKELVEEAHHPGVRPPGRPTNGPTGLANTRTFAAYAYYFGAIDPETGEKDPNAWRSIGYDIDGLNTTETLAASDDPGTCRAQPSLLAALPLRDGYEGRDNNWGSQIIPQLFGAASSSLEETELSIGTGIAEGRPTHVLKISDLNAGPDDPDVTVGVMLTQSTSTGPSMDGTSRMRIDSRTMEPDKITPKMLFTHAYLTDNVLVTGDFNAPSEAPFLLPLAPVDLTLTPLVFTITAKLDDAHQKILWSTLSMVVSISDVALALRPLAIDTKFAGFDCETPFEQYVKFVGGFADLSLGKANFLDSSGQSPCDAMSVAFQLDWVLVRNPDKDDVHAVVPSAGPCPE